MRRISDLRKAGFNVSQAAKGLVEVTSPTLFWYFTPGVAKTPDEIYEALKPADKFASGPRVVIEGKCDSEDALINLEIVPGPEFDRVARLYEQFLDSDTTSTAEKQAFDQAVNQLVTA